MPQVTVRNFHPKQECVESETCSRAYKIVEYAHDSAKALHDAFVTLKGGRAGAATDEEQDVLRAMLVSAGAGLDSTLKQLFRNALQKLIFDDENVREGIEKFIERELRRPYGESALNTNLLAKALVEPLPITHLSERYVYDLTGSSLQSADQLFAAAAALGIDPNAEAHLDKNDLTKIFTARNKIVHEMDIDFTAARRNRIQRRVNEMVRMTNVLLEHSQMFVELVQVKADMER